MAKNTYILYLMNKTKVNFKWLFQNVFRNDCSMHSIQVHFHFGDMFRSQRGAHSAEMISATN